MESLIDLLKTQPPMVTAAMVTAAAAMVTAFAGLATSLLTATLNSRFQKRLERDKASLTRELEQRKIEVAQELETLRSKYQSDLERLRASLATSAADSGARRSYEYDTRKRLYTDCEPIFFQLAEACDSALRACRELARPKVWDDLRVVKENVGANGPWMLNRSSELIGIFYSLFSPLALYLILRDRLTMIDCSVDQSVWFRFALAREMYIAFQSDAELAACHPPLTYDPLIPGWRQKRLEQPAVHWWQGMSPGRLDRAVRRFIVHDGQTSRLMTFGEFEDLYVDTYEGNDVPSQKLLGIAANALYGFCPQDRPAFLRVLMVAIHVYYALCRPIPEDSKNLISDDLALAKYLRVSDTTFEGFNIGQHCGTHLKNLENLAVAYLSRRLRAAADLASSPVHRVPAEDRPTLSF